MSLDSVDQPLPEDIQTHNPGEFLTHGTLSPKGSLALVLHSGDMEAQRGWVAGSGSHDGGLPAFTQMGHKPAQPPSASNKERGSGLETRQKLEMELALRLSVGRLG